MFFQQEKDVDLLLPVFTPRSEHFFAKSKKRKEIDVFFLSLLPTVASGLRLFFIIDYEDYGLCFKEGSPGGASKNIVA